MQTIFAIPATRKKPMADCCDSKKKSHPDNSDSHLCPGSKKAGKAVSLKTILHHVNKPWTLSFSDQDYYFCDDPDCDVVYFSREGTTITKSQLRFRVGVKEKSDDALICYCFGVSRGEAQSNPAIKKFVTEQTKNGVCSCTTHNPSGKCCLKDFPT